MAPIIRPEDAGLWKEYLSRFDTKWSIHTPLVPLSGELFIADGTSSPPYNNKFKFEWYELRYNGAVLKFSVKVFGERPDSGYKLYFGLHGGGEDHPDDNYNYPGGLSNNKSWSHLQIWYEEAIKKQGGAIYVIPRGVNDEWDLFETPETHVLFERLIMLMLTPHPLQLSGSSQSTIKDDSAPLVDANHVYISGFSAGGDGVYRLATHLADRFAAANMSAGHPGGVKLNNLCNVPMILQVGDQDTNARHNTITVDKAFELDELAKGVPGYYAHRCFVHLTGLDGSKGAQEEAHYIWSASERGLEQGTVIDPTSKGELEKFKAAPLTYKAAGVKKDTSAIGLISEVTRKPLSPTIVWNFDSRPPKPGNLQGYDLKNGERRHEWRQKLFFYWLYIYDPTSSDFHDWDMAEKSRSSSDEENEKNVLRVSYSKNTITFFDEPRTYVGVLLNQAMMNLSEPINISINNGGTALKPVSVKPSDEIKRQTLDARGDPYYIFSAAIWFSKSTSGAWEAKAADNLFAPPRIKSKL